MKVAIGADHRGLEAATRLAEGLTAQGHQVNLHTPPRGEACDYPEIAWTVGQALAAAHVDMGVLVCGTGVGMCIAANKINGVRAASVHDELTAEICRSHNDANVICLSADLLGHQLIERIVDQCLRTPFTGGRHARRLEKIVLIERGEDPQSWEEGRASA